ncbi:MAG: TolC family protein [Polyangiales bacterium]
MHSPSTRSALRIAPLVVTIGAVLPATAMSAPAATSPAPSTSTSASTATTASIGPAESRDSLGAIPSSFTSGDATRLSPGKLPLAADGLTADSVADRAAKTSVVAKIDQAKLAAAAAAVDLAWDAYIPRLSFRGAYTHVSHIDPPPAGPGLPVALLPVKPDGTLDSSRSPIAPQVVLNPPGGQSGSYAAFTQFSLSGLLPRDDQWAFGASLIVPLSDYVGKLYQQKDAVLKSKEAVEWNAKVNLAQTRFDARSAFYNWIRARGSVVVAGAALEQSKAHLRDLKSMLALKAATLADVYRVEAQVAAADLTLTRSENMAIVSEENLRIMMHSNDTDVFHLGEDVSTELPRLEAELPKLRADARAKRPELQAIVAQIDSAQSSATVASSGMFPQLSAFGDALYANPNQRWAFFDPTSFKFTWDVGLQLTWSPNDVLIASDTRRQLDTVTAQLKGMREQIEDALLLDVVTAFTKVREEESAVVSAGAQRRAAEEAYRVRVEQFHGGVATSSMLIDSESDLTLARLSDLNARVDLRIAHVQLKKSVGAL